MGSMDHTPFQDPNKVELTELHRSTASEQNLFGGLEHIMMIRVMTIIGLNELMLNFECCYRK